MIEEELLLAAITTTDTMTGLSNRLGFSLTSEHLLAMCRRMEVPASLLALALTNLIEIEATPGHQTAECAIVEFGNLPQARFGDSDVIARLATNLFGVLLIGTNLDGADRGQERLSNLVTEQNLGGQAGYEVELGTDVIVYNTERHANADVLVQEAKGRSLQARSDQDAKAAGALS